MAVSLLFVKEKSCHLFCTEFVHLFHFHCSSSEGLLLRYCPYISLSARSLSKDETHKRIHANMKLFGNR